MLDCVYPQCKLRLTGRTLMFLNFKYLGEITKKKKFNLHTLVTYQFRKQQQIKAPKSFVSVALNNEWQKLHQFT